MKATVGFMPKLMPPEGDGIHALRNSGALNLAVLVSDSCPRLKRQIPRRRVVRARVQISPSRRNLGMTQCRLHQMDRRAALKAVRSMGMAE